MDATSESIQRRLTNVEFLGSSQQGTPRQPDEAYSDSAPNYQAAWLKELKRIKEDSIIIPNNSTVWEVAKALIDARGKVKTWSGNYQIQNIYDTDEIASIGKHLMNYVNVEDSDTYYEYWKQ